MKKILIISIFFTFSCIKILSQSFAELGIAKIEGRITGAIPSGLNKNSLFLTISNSITSDRIEYSIPINDNGFFSYEVPISYPSLNGIESDLYNGIIPLSPNEKTVLNIHFNENGEKEIEILDKEGYTAIDMLNIMPRMMDILKNQHIIPEQQEIMLPNEYSAHVMRRIVDVLDIVDSDTILSEKAKSIMKSELELFYLNNSLFDYIGYINRNKDENKPLSMEENLNESYYYFLRNFNLNESRYISSSYYHIVLQSILKNKFFALPKIESDIEEWVVNAKSKLKNVLGYNNGLFYDLLVCNAYANQLNSMIPLNIEQVIEIKKYFKDNGKEVLSDIIIAENHRVLNLIAQGKNSKQDSIVKPKENFEKNDFIENIINKYKNKVIVIDFWATWCGPCIKAIRETENLKAIYGKDKVVFVYVTTESSPRKNWEIMKKNITGEHYYVEKNVWNQLMDELDLLFIPSYLFIDENGNLKDKKTPFPGIEKFKEIIDSLQ